MINYRLLEQRRKRQKNSTYKIFMHPAARALLFFFLFFFAIFLFLLIVYQSAPYCLHGDHQNSIPAVDDSSECSLSMPLPFAIQQCKYCSEILSPSFFHTSSLLLWHRERESLLPVQKCEILCPQTGACDEDVNLGKVASSCWHRS